MSPSLTPPTTVRFSESSPTEHLYESREGEDPRGRGSSQFWYDREELSSFRRRDILICKVARWIINGKGEGSYVSTEMTEKEERSYLQGHTFRGLENNVDPGIERNRFAVMRAVLTEQGRQRDRGRQQDDADKEAIAAASRLASDVAQIMARNRGVADALAVNGRGRHHRKDEANKKELRSNSHHQRPSRDKALLLIGRTTMHIRQEVKHGAN